MNTLPTTPPAPNPDDGGDVRLLPALVNGKPVMIGLRGGEVISRPMTPDEERQLGRRLALAMGRLN